MLHNFESVVRKARDAHISGDSKAFRKAVKEYIAFHNGKPSKEEIDKMCLDIVSIMYKADLV